MKHFLLTIMFISATVVSAENTTALKSLEIFARQGDLNAQIKLANAYRKGIGVSQDYKTAVKWFTLAARQGNAGAQYNLGVMHSFGLGVVPDYKSAVKWYSLAAKQDHALAQYNLGRLYYLGQGVSENMIYAHMWTKQASSNGFVMGEELNELLSELMTSSQIEDAHKLGKQCLATDYREC